MKALEAWLTYLRNHEQLLVKKYKPDALLRTANTSNRRLFDEIIIAVQPLSVLPFDLDIALLEGAISLTTSIAMPLASHTGAEI